MKRSFSALCLLCALSLPVPAGEVDTPGKTQPPPPPCTENCPSAPAGGTTATSGSTLDATTLETILVLLGIVTP